MNTDGRNFLYSSTTDADLRHALHHFDFDRVPIVMADHLPSELTGPVISNTESSSKTGKHWVTFLPRAHGGVDFFDSYGLNCYQNPYYAMKEYIPVSWRIRHLQGDKGKRSVQSMMSNVCGTYAVCEIICERVFGANLPSLLSMVEVPMDVDRTSEGVKLAVNDTMLADFMAEMSQYTDQASLKRNKEAIVHNVKKKHNKT